MNTETIFFTLFIIWNFNHFAPQNLLFLFKILYNRCCIHSDILAEHLFKDLFKDLFENKNVDEIRELDNVKPEIKYEDKYLIEFQKLDKEFIFTDIEEELKAQKYIEFYEKINKSYTDKLDIIKKEIRKTEIKLTKYEENDDYCICDDDDDSNISRTKEETIKFLIDEKCKLQLDFDKLNEDKDNDTINKQSEEMVKKFMVDQRLDKLKNCFIIENTPLGNVLMIFDKELETFKYYSDNTIPYRYLETVGRKYAKQFCCRPIFVDMEEELKISEIKWEKERKEKEEKEEAIKNNITIDQKKSVFTKFKSYNKDAGTGHVNIAPPPKNNISNKYLTEKQEQEKILLKERANRYTYEGKFANFSFIKKVDRKLVDKKFAMTFADFKKMQMGAKI